LSLSAKSSSEALGLVQVMMQGRLFRAFCLRALLITLAIHGITPDAKDLASINALKLLWPAATGADQKVDDDEFPDDVCEPVRVEFDLRRCQPAYADSSPLPRWATDDVQFGRARFGAIQFAAGIGSLTRKDRLIHSLCRFKC
jgi:hypothetical protein